MPSSFNEECNLRCQGPLIFCYVDTKTHFYICKNGRCGETAVRKFIIFRVLLIFEKLIFWRFFMCACLSVFFQSIIVITDVIAALHKVLLLNDS